MTKILTLSAIAVLAVGCGGVQSSPVAPSQAPALALQPPTPPPVADLGPHFALEISPSDAVTYEGEPWRGTVAVLPNISIVRAEMPARVVTSCGGVTATHPPVAAGASFSCLLPVGTHSIGAVAEMADGRRFQTAINATVVYRPAITVPVYYDVALSSRDWTDVVFGTQTYEGAEYRWSFGDGATTTTLMNGAGHRYEHAGTGGTKERMATVQIVRRSDGRLLATGSVVGIW